MCPLPIYDIHGPCQRLLFFQIQSSLVMTNGANIGQKTLHERLLLHRYVKELAVYTREAKPCFIQTPDFQISNCASSW